MERQSGWLMDTEDRIPIVFVRKRHASTLVDLFLSQNLGGRNVMFCKSQYFLGVNLKIVKDLNVKS